MSRINELLDTVAQELHDFGRKELKPIAPWDLNQFSQEFTAAFGIAPPEAYIAFLNRSNGLVYAAIKICSGELEFDGNTNKSIFANNLLWQDAADDYAIPEWKNYIFYAVSGDDVWVYDKATKEFKCLDRVSGDLMSSFESAEQMLVNVLELMTEE